MPMILVWRRMTVGWSSMGKQLRDTTCVSVNLRSACLYWQKFRGMCSNCCIQRSHTYNESLHGGASRIINTLSWIVPLGLCLTFVSAVAGLKYLSGSCLKETHHGFCFLVRYCLLYLQPAEQGTCYYCLQQYSLLALQVTFIGQANYVTGLTCDSDVSC